MSTARKALWGTGGPRENLVHEAVDVGLRPRKQRRGERLPGPKELRCGGHQGRLAREHRAYLSGQAGGAKKDGHDSTHGRAVKVGGPGVRHKRISFPGLSLPHCTSEHVISHFLHLKSRGNSFHIVVAKEE